MKNLILFVILATLFSCGKSSAPSTYQNNRLSFHQSDLPLTLKVPRHKYEQFKEHFDETEETFRSLSGKTLVTFIPGDDDPKFINYADASSLWENYGEMWVLFKDNDSEFTDIDSKTAGLAHYYFSGNRLLHGNIFLNFSVNQWSNVNLRQILMHELGHMLGFNHTEGSDYSIMNYDYVFDIDGISNEDLYRLHEKYPFSLAAISFKDLEKIGASLETMEVEALTENLINYGLSSERASKLGKMMNSYSKIKNKRALTSREKDVFTKELTGMSFDKASSVLVEEGYDALVEKASDINGIDPEAVKELLNEVM